ncbi:hypothetical protein EV121DRAFT_297331 [Schizophyllum commune]
MLFSVFLISFCIASQLRSTTTAFLERAPSIDTERTNRCLRFSAIGLRVDVWIAFTPIFPIHDGNLPLAVIDANVALSLPAPTRAAGSPQEGGLLLFPAMRIRHTGDSSTPPGQERDLARSSTASTRRRIRLDPRCPRRRGKDVGKTQAVSALAVCAMLALLFPLHHLKIDETPRRGLP